MSSRVERARAAELATSDLFPTCPDCHEIAHPAATVCEGCGTHLFQRVGSGRPFAADSKPHCTCGGEGICTVCVIALLDEGQPL